MSVNLYADKFRHQDRDHDMYSGNSYSLGASSSAGSKSKGKSGWEVIKKAIFTPIGTKDVSNNRRRRSRRNISESQRDKAEASDYRETTSQSQDVREDYNSIRIIGESEINERTSSMHFPD